MRTKEIIYCGKKAILACDGNCKKAWGNNERPKLQLSEDEDDYAFLADSEVSEVTERTSWEGGEGRPDLGGEMNKWCARECERSTLFLPNEPIKLQDFSKRVYNFQSRCDNA